MDCSKCGEMEIKFIIFNDGNYSNVLWCNMYKAPCFRAMKNCELRVLDEKCAEKVKKGMRIGSKRKEKYEEKEAS